ncbi:MAG TPA: 3-dehydroquinate synthase [Candidatus Acidoferrales bacterium]|jgi:3-dehydroquinate synthase|nr:3-dehydroquinate synthase [Candidatus Acidoferrales bacterium]
MKSTQTKAIEVRAATGKYSVVCRRGAIGQAQREIARLGKFSGVHILSSPLVWHALEKRIRHGIPARLATHVHLFDDAESEKNLQSVEGLAQSLVSAGADRHALIVAIGGGVVGDVGGFVAASYLRGVALVHVPTTLVAQVDSAIGGKTGVNLPEGKNLVGAFYPPRLVLADPELLATLPEREFRGGLAEVIKYGVIADARLFVFLEKQMDAILRRDSGALEHVIRRSIQIKAQVVSKDEKESGLREILNFGHTFGHALESVTRYRRFQHGEAVAWGMMCAALLGHEVAGTPADEVSRIVALVRRMGPLPPWPDVKPKEILSAMCSDKKAREGKLRFVLAPKLGRARTFGDVPEKTVECILRCAPQVFVKPVETLGKCNG